LIIAFVITALIIGGTVLGIIFGINGKKNNGPAPPNQFPLLFMVQNI
jgi:hypothetical protein